MSATIGQIGFGMKLSYSSTIGGSYTELVDLVEIKPYGLKVGVSDATHHQSPNVAMEALPSLIEFDDLEATVSWSKTSYPAFTALLRLVKYWKITYPVASGDTNGSTDIFPGFIVEISPATPIKDRMQCTLKIHPTGLSTFTAGS